MALRYDTSRSELAKRSGLIFDAEGVTLIARCNDELSAYRAKKNWVLVLKSYFLLELERDYELSVLASPEQGYFTVSCFFISACGRYAFWRLINDQAPEAELKLGALQTSNSSPCRPSLFGRLKSPSSTIPTPAILGGPMTNNSTAIPSRFQQFLLRMKRLFR